MIWVNKAAVKKNRGHLGKHEEEHVWHPRVNYFTRQSSYETSGEYCIYVCTPHLKKDRDKLGVAIEVWKHDLGVEVEGSMSTHKWKDGDQLFSLATRQNDLSQFISPQHKWSTIKKHFSSVFIATGIVLDVSNCFHNIKYGKCEQTVFQRLS